MRNDASHSNILLQTSDATWEAYNDYGGNSLYTCTVACPPGEPEAYKAAYAVSYNRPFDGSFTTDGGASYLYYAEYQMIHWLEENGYNVSYTSEAEVDHNGALLKNHKVFISSGHDEYWSAGQRANVEAAREAGVNLAFFSGNEIFWKTRWGPSTEGSNTPYRTLTTYKETHFNAPVDPKDPSTWTGHVARSALQSPRRRRPAGKLPDRPAVRGQLGHLRHHRALAVQQAAPVAQHGGRDAAAGTDADARARDRDARLRVGRGRRQRLPAGGRVRPVLDDRQRTAGLQRLRQQL